MWQRTVGMLPDSEANASKLQEMVDEQARTLLRLGAQWEKHRAPLVQRFRDARRTQSNKAVSQLFNTSSCFILYFQSSIENLEK